MRSPMPKWPSGRLRCASARTSAACWKRPAPGKSLEAHVALFANDEDAKAALDAVKSVDLPEIFIVSNVSTNETAPAEGAVVGQGVNFPGLTVAVTEAEGTECPRCAAVCKSLGVVFE